jgi:hypothetical protein
MVNSLMLDFPEPWTVLPVGGDGRAAVDRLVADVADLGDEAQSAMSQFLSAALPALADLGVDGFASLVLPEEGSGGLVQAFCAVGNEPGPATEERLRSIAEGGLHPDLERDTTTVRIPLGTAVRSSAVRWADELVDSEGVAPYAAEVRFTFPLDGDRIGILHFETLSLVYLEELEELFDAIAGTARVG